MCSFDRRHSLPRTFDIIPPISVARSNPLIQCWLSAKKGDKCLADEEPSGFLLLSTRSRGPPRVEHVVVNLRRGGFSPTEGLSDNHSVSSNVSELCSLQSTARFELEIGQAPSLHFPKKFQHVFAMSTIFQEHERPRFIRPSPMSQNVTQECLGRCVLGARFVYRKHPKKQSGETPFSRMSHPSLKSISRVLALPSIPNVVQEL